MQVMTITHTFQYMGIRGLVCSDRTNTWGCGAPVGLGSNSAWYRYGCTRHPGGTCPPV